MPIYNIRCNKCNVESEILASYNVASNLNCDICGTKVEIVPSPAMFRIEGACAANGYDTASNIPDDHYDPRVGQTSWEK